MVVEVEVCGGWGGGVWEVCGGRGGGVWEECGGRARGVWLERWRCTVGGVEVRSGRCVGV